MNYRGLLLIVVLALMVLPAAPAAACSGPDAALLNWYDVNLRVDPGPLPAGVSITPVKNQYVKVSNRGAAPLYVIAPSSQGGPDQSLPKGWVATHKLEGGALFTWGDGRWVRVGSLTFVALELNAAAISPTLTISLPKGEGRPAGPAPADPTARLILLYDGEQLDVPIVLDYRLDSRYDPDLYQKMSGPCGHSGELFINLLINLGVCLGVLVVTAIVVWIVRLKPPASPAR